VSILLDMTSSCQLIGRHSVDSEDEVVVDFCKINGMKSKIASSCFFFKLVD
jgi:hypothetical protein